MGLGFEYSGFRQLIWSSAMAGTYYGLDGIPEHYKSVENFELLKSLDRELINIDI